MDAAVDDNNELKKATDDDDGGSSDDFDCIFNACVRVLSIWPHHRTQEEAQKKNEETAA